MSLANKLFDGERMLGTELGDGSDDPAEFDKLMDGVLAPINQAQPLTAAFTDLLDEPMVELREQNELLWQRVEEQGRQLEALSGLASRVAELEADRDLEKAESEARRAEETAARAKAVKDAVLLQSNRIANRAFRRAKGQFLRNCFGDWEWVMRRKRHIRKLAQTGINRWEQQSVAKSVLPWIAASRKRQVEKVAEARAKVAEAEAAQIRARADRLEEAHASHSSAAEAVRADVDKLVQADKERGDVAESEVADLRGRLAEQRDLVSTELTEVSTKLGARAEQLDSQHRQYVERSQAEREEERRQRREHLVEKTVQGVVRRWRGNIAFGAFCSWAERTERKRRIRNLAQRAAAQIDAPTVGKTFAPWLAAARAKIRERESEALKQLAADRVLEQMSESLRDQRQRAILGSLQRTVRQMQNTLLASAVRSWGDWAQHRRRTRTLMKRGIAKMEHTAVDRSFTPWLAAARAKNQRQVFATAAEKFAKKEEAEAVRMRYGQWLCAARAKQAEDRNQAADKMQGRLEEVYERLAERQHTDALVLTGLGEEFEQLRFDQAQETQQRHTQIDLINQALAAFADQVDDNAALQRRRRIERKIARALLRVRFGAAQDCLLGWLEYAKHRKRVMTLAAKAGLRIQNSKVASFFCPWLMAARGRLQHQAKSKAEKFESLEYRVLRLDGTLTSHEKHSSEMIEDVVEQLDEVKTTVERCVAGLAAEQAAEHALDEADVRVPPLPTLPLLKKLA